MAEVAAEFEEGFGTHGGFVIGVWVGHVLGGEFFAVVLFAGLTQNNATTGITQTNQPQTS